MITKIFGSHDANTLAQLGDVATRADRVALMADGHLGYIMPIGGVAAYRNKVSVTGVGFDIACGNAAILTDLSIVDVEDRIVEIADTIHNMISFGIGRNNKCSDAPIDHELFDRDEWELVPYEHRQSLRDKARNQLGTVGSGNHYVDIFIDELDRVWVGVHFGSRGLGHTIASAFLSMSQGKKWGERVPEAEALLELNTWIGRDYWDLMELAGQYAYVGREWVARKVVEMIGGKELKLIHNHHNYAWREMHNTLYGGVINRWEEFIVIRKGATPAKPGQLSFVGGSMGDDSVILEGVESEESRLAMYSTVHGAGRVMSRTEAAGKRNRKTGEIKKAGKVSREMMEAWLKEKGVVLRGGGLDESPHAYRRLDNVLEAQGETVRIVHRLQPLIVVMAGEEEYDPYKD